MRNSMIAATLLSALLVTGASAATVPVDIMDSSFSPESLIVAPGDTVVWTHRGAFPHTTTSGIDGSPDGIWDSGTMSNGQSFSFVFADEGDYPYYCTFHYLGGMTGNVKVGPAGIEEESGTIGRRLATTITRGSVRLLVPTLLVDPSGQTVARLQPGNNDLSALAPGLYSMLPVELDAAPGRLIVAR